jgi:hypothetical protein
MMSPNLKCAEDLGQLLACLRHCFERARIRNDAIVCFYHKCPALKVFYISHNPGWMAPFWWKKEDVKPSIIIRGAVNKAHYSQPKISLTHAYKLNL